MGVTDVTPPKPPHGWCSHVKHPGGCGIYRTRPESCRTFYCMWMMDERIKDHWFPAKSKIVIHANVEHGAKYINFIVDPAYPLRWREEPWFSEIKHMAKRGIEGVLGEKWTTVVQVGDQHIPIIGSERLLRAAE
jgi:Fe-S-cluster containining protein